ncbi:hypothetical protein DQ237_18930 [Blastococcus sp. TF02-8]|uniref:peptidase inhibitor family I36 protein n=1 Tax=Blastococcus sp. TF02-8 TaxID=2250574 RepID=UPI000DE87E48|nr:hypothetical protein DQ237_18930 [Blastococcus sp. TF02-8]
MLLLFVVPSANAATTCSSGYVCMWEDYSYTGSQYVNHRDGSITSNAFDINGWTATTRSARRRTRRTRRSAPTTTTTTRARRCASPPAGRSHLHDGRSCTPVRIETASDDHSTAAGERCQLPLRRGVDGAGGDLLRRVP